MFILYYDFSLVNELSNFLLRSQCLLINDCWEKFKNEDITVGLQLASEVLGTFVSLADYALSLSLAGCGEVPRLEMKACEEMESEKEWAQETEGSRVVKELYLGH